MPTTRTSSAREHTAGARKKGQESSSLLWSLREGHRHPSKEHRERNSNYISSHLITHFLWTDGNREDNFYHLDLLGKPFAHHGLIMSSWTYSREEDCQIDNGSMADQEIRSLRATSPSY